MLLSSELQAPLRSHYLPLSILLAGRWWKEQRPFKDKPHGDDEFIDR